MSSLGAEIIQQYEKMQLTEKIATFKRKNPIELSVWENGDRIYYCPKCEIVFHGEKRKKCYACGKNVRLILFNQKISRTEFYRIFPEK